MQRKYIGPILFGGTLLFTQDLAQQIMTLLQKQPYAEVAPLIAKMNDEATHQPPPRAPTAPPPIPPTPPAPTPEAPFPPPAPSAAPAAHVPDLPPADIPPEPK